MVLVLFLGSVTLGQAATTGKDLDGYANAASASISVQRVFRDALPSVADYTQTAYAQTAYDGEVESDDALATAICGSPICGPDQRWILWDTPFLDWTRQDSRDGVNGYDFNASGFATGISRLVSSNTTFGLAVGYDARELRSRDALLHTVKADAFHAAFYGGTVVGGFNLDAYAGFSLASERSKRNFADAASFATANYTDYVWSGGVKVSYAFAPWESIRIIPSAGLDYSHLSTSTLNESQAGAALFNGKAKKADSLQLPLLVTFNHTLNSRFLSYGGVPSRWTFEARGGWVPELGSQKFKYNASSAAGDKFSGRSVTRGRSYSTTGAGMKIQLNNRWIFGIDYDYQFDSDYSEHILSGTYGISF
jgi:outer membrane autotransporter protein